MSEPPADTGEPMPPPAQNAPPVRAGCDRPTRSSKDMVNLKPAAGPACRRCRRRARRRRAHQRLGTRPCAARSRRPAPSAKGRPTSHAVHHSLVDVNAAERDGARARVGSDAKARCRTWGRRRRHRGPLRTRRPTAPARGGASSARGSVASLLFDPTCARGQLVACRRFECRQGSSIMRARIKITRCLNFPHHRIPEVHHIGVGPEKPATRCSMPARPHNHERRVRGAEFASEAGRPPAPAPALLQDGLDLSR